jgi:hypothetical protein
MDVFHLLSIVEPVYFRIAEVVGVMKHPVVEIVEGVEAGGSFTIWAKLCAPVHKDSHDFFLVKISKPSEFASLQPEKGSQMEHGKFSFDSVRNLKIGDKLEVLISPASPV